MAMSTGATFANYNLGVGQPPAAVPPPPRPPGSSSSSISRTPLDPADFPPILQSRTLNGLPSHSTLRNYVSATSKGLVNAPSESSLSGSCNTITPSSIISSINSSNSSSNAALLLASQQPLPSVSNSSNCSNAIGRLPLRRTSPEFSTHDFPALPSTTKSAGHLHHHQLMTNGDTSSSTPSPTTTSSSAIAPPPLSLINHHQHQLTSSSSASGVQLFAANNMVTNIPPDVIKDRFGMIGLYKLINIGFHDTSLNILAPGLDLSSLHSKWQSTSELHQSLGTPFSDFCVGRPQDMDYAVPPEYLIRNSVNEHLGDPTLDKLLDSTLFWLFYNCCREQVQLVAAKELYRREWRFHKGKQVWLQRLPGSQFSSDSKTEKGDYAVWEPVKCQKTIVQSLSLSYSDLDTGPSQLQLSSNTLGANVNLVQPPNPQSQVPLRPNSQRIPAAATSYQQQQHPPSQYSLPPPQMGGAFAHPPGTRRPTTVPVPSSGSTVVAPPPPRGPLVDSLTGARGLDGSSSSTVKH